MVTEIKKHIFNFLSYFQKIKLLAKGIKCGSGCIINGAPYIQKMKHSSIILGNNVTLTSRKRHNPLINHSVALRTISPEAVIELHDQSGISGSTIVCCNHITIGEYTIIGADTLIYDSDGHQYSPEKGWNSPRLKTGRPINIGKRCFIGVRCTILGGVTIGDNCVISAGSVITEDIPSGHKAFGNPAQFVPLPQILGGPAEKPTPIPKAEIDTPQKFLEKISCLLELNREISIEDEFRSYEEWDSLAFLCLSTMLKEDYGVELNSGTLNTIKTWTDVYKLIC